MKIVAVNSSETKGTRKSAIHEGILKEEFGLSGDAHADCATNRQVSLLSVDSIAKMRRLGIDVGPGDFAENLTCEGIDLVSLPLGTHLQVGDEAIVEISQIGKECHTGCAIRRQVGKCIMPVEGVFARVLHGGRVRPGDTIKMLDAHG